MSTPKLFFEVTEVSWRNRHYQPLSFQFYSEEHLKYNKFNKEEKNPSLCFHGQLP